jgi:hypothetical protein
MINVRMYTVHRGDAETLGDRTSHVGIFYVLMFIASLSVIKNSEGC